MTKPQLPLQLRIDTYESKSTYEENTSVGPTNRTKDMKMKRVVSILLLLAFTPVVAAFFLPACLCRRHHRHHFNS